MWFMQSENDLKTFSLFMFQSIFPSFSQKKKNETALLKHSQIVVS